jgi:hypothetical protein
LSSPYPPQDMALRGRIGAYRLHATHDSREVTAPARRAFRARFEAQVDPRATLSPDERARRAEMALRAHMAQLAYRSARARSGRAATRKNGGGSDA